MSDLVPGLDGSIALVVGLIIVLGLAHYANWRQERKARRALMQEPATTPDLTPRSLGWLADLDSFLDDPPKEEETDGPATE